MVSQLRIGEVTMSITTIIKEVKNIHPEDIAMVKVGNFYRVYGLNTRHF